jgi:hypothetical protein
MTLPSSRSERGEVPYIHRCRAAQFHPRPRSCACAHRTTSRDPGPDTPPARRRGSRTASGARPGRGRTPRPPPRLLRSSRTGRPRPTRTPAARTPSAPRPDRRRRATHARSPSPASSSRHNLPPAAPETAPASCGGPAAAGVHPSSTPAPASPRTASAWSAPVVAGSCAPSPPVRAATTGSCCATGSSTARSRAPTCLGGNASAVPFLSSTSGTPLRFPTGQNPSRQVGGPGSVLDRHRPHLWVSFRSAATPGRIPLGLAQASCDGELLPR